MARKGTNVSTPTVLMTTDEREKLIATMKELAARGPSQTALMMRVANAGGITEVSSHIKTLRVMFKKFAGNMTAAADDEDTPTPRTRRGKKSASRARTSSRNSATEGTATE